MRCAARCYPPRSRLDGVTLARWTRRASACCGGFGGSCASRERCVSTRGPGSRATTRPRRGGSSRGGISGKRKGATSRMCSPRGSARRPRPRQLLRGGDADGQAPGPARREQLVRVDVLEPADEVLLGLVIRGTVDCAPLARRSAVEVVAALECRLALLARRPLHLPPRHAAMLAGETRYKARLDGRTRAGRASRTRLATSRS